MTNSNSQRLMGRTIFQLLLVGFFIELIFRFVLAFSYVPETGGFSLDVLYGIIRMLNGRSLYPNPELPPYPVIQYMPLHYYVVAGVSQLMGVGQSIHAVSTLNRLLCIFFNLLIFIPVRRIFKNIFEINDRLISWAVFFCIFLLIQPTDYAGPGSLYLLALLFSIYYFLCFLNLYSNKYGSELVLSGILGGIACFTDQIGFVVQGAILLFLLLYIKDQKATIRYALSGGLAYLFLTIILIGSSFKYWFLNIFSGLSRPANFYITGENFPVSVASIVYLLAALGITISFFITNTLKTREKFLRFLVISILLYSLAGKFIFGSTDNNFEGGLVLSLILFIVCISFYEWIKATRVIFMVCVFVIFIINRYEYNTLQYLGQLKVFYNDYKDCTIVSTYVRQNVKNDEYIFSGSQNENMMSLLIGAKALFPNRDMVLKNTFPRKIFNYDDFGQRIKDGKIKYLIGKGGIQPDNFLNQVFEGYVKESTINGYDIYILKASR